MKRSATLDQRAIDLVFLEARLLDEARYVEWLDLFAEDGYYWMPLTVGQQDPLREASIMYEDKLMLRMRTQRLHAASAPSLQAPGRCLHVLQNPTVESLTDTECVTRCATTYFESRGDRQQLLGAIAWHHWVAADDRVLLSLKRIDLVNCEAALPALHLFL